MKEEEKHLIYCASQLYSIKQNFNERTKQDQISMFLQDCCNGGAEFEKHSQIPFEYIHGTKPSLSDKWKSCVSIAGIKGVLMALLSEDKKKTMDKDSC
ncbi:hypothetical protein Peur_010765 [Populus x canadensis]